MNDYRLKSGERQVGTKMSDIRADHTARYAMVVDKVCEIHRSTAWIGEVYGLDAFCGNGYGTYMLASQANCVVHGIDASADAIQLANQHFATPGTLFSVKEFPCTLPHQAYDFVVSMESVEHVENNFEFVSSLVRAVKPGGYLFLSTPNSDVLSLKLNPNKFHHRHFTYTELVEMVGEIRPDMELIEYFGQNCYVMKDGKVLGRAPDSEMGLRPQYMNGQFHCFIFRKPILS